MRGTVIRILLNKGYGFVRGEDGISRFMHSGYVIPKVDFDKMYEGQSVEFTPDESGPPDKGNGLRAINVKVL